LGRAAWRVRKTSPVPETLPFLNCGSRPCKSFSFDYVVSLVQSKSPAEDADHVAFSLKVKLRPSYTPNCSALIRRDGKKCRHISEGKTPRPRLRRGQTLKQWCRCAYSRAQLAACAPYPPPSGALIAPPPHRCSRDGHCGCSRCSGRRDRDWRRSCHSTSTSPTRREATRTRRSSLPPDMCTDPHGTHAQLAPDCAVGQAASAASAAPIEPSTSAARQPASPVRPLSACRCTRPSHAHAHARPAFDPATAAVR
jgi:hypothetical protein